MELIHSEVLSFTNNLFKVLPNIDENQKNENNPKKHIEFYKLLLIIAIIYLVLPKSLFILLVYMIFLIFIILYGLSKVAMKNTKVVVIEEEEEEGNNKEDKQDEIKNDV